VRTRSPAFEHNPSGHCFIAAPEHEKMRDERLWDLRQKRDREMHGIPQWEELRALASSIKEHTLTHLDDHLEQFEANARSNGIAVHWARHAAEHNRIVHGILEDHGALHRLLLICDALSEHSAYFDTGGRG